MTVPILAAVRSPFAEADGVLAGWHPVDLSVEIANAAITRAGVTAASLDHVWVGCDEPVGAQGANLARAIVLAAGWPVTLGGTVVEAGPHSGVAALSAAIVILTITGIWIGLTMPFFSLVLMGGSGIVKRGVESQRHQLEMRRLLGQASSPAVAQRLWDQREDLIKDGRFEGREQWVTVLISDTCSFTGLSEKLTPSSLMQWLNRGISIGVQAVTSRGGMVNKFTGDGMLAVFGAPVSSGAGEDAANAVAAALAIQQQIADLNRSLSQEGQPAMRMRIGIHSGTVLTGSLGSRERLEYAVIGDTVNCASRLESLQKERHEGVVRVLVSSETKRLLSELPAEVHSKNWGAISIKGRQEPLEVIELKSTPQ